MICKISNLLVDIPDEGGMAPLCEGYRTDEQGSPDIVLEKERYRPKNWPTLSYEKAIYMESGFQFYFKLLDFSGMMLHASAVALDERAYLFSGPSGMGKSTHTQLWQSTFGEGAKVFNDDKPALRYVDGRWFAYGTPWCGKDGININMKVPLAGICFLRRGDKNEIRRLSMQEAAARILGQTPWKFKKVENLDKLLKLVDRLVRDIPVYELFNKPEPEAARLSYETMRRGAEEANLL